MSRVRNVPKNQIVLYQGEATMQYHLITEGVVRAYTILENGSEVVIALHSPGDFFPSSAATTGAVFSLFYYETMTSVRLESYPVDEFAGLRNRLLADDPDYWSHRYLGALLHINALAQMTAGNKLARTLQYLAIRFGKELTAGVLMRIELKLTQQDLANLSGMSRETVNIELAKLKAANIVSEKAKFYTVHMKSLLKYLGDDSLPSNPL